MPICQECRSSVPGPLQTTVTGRRICDACNDRLLGAAAGILVANGSGRSAVASGIATSGWFSRIRGMRRRRTGAPGS